MLNAYMGYNWIYICIYIFLLCNSTNLEILYDNFFLKKIYLLSIQTEEVYVFSAIKRCVFSITRSFDVPFCINLRF